MVHEHSETNLSIKLDPSRRWHMNRWYILLYTHYHVKSFSGFAAYIQRKMDLLYVHPLTLPPRREEYDTITYKYDPTYSRPSNCSRSALSLEACPKHAHHKVPFIQF